MMLLHPIFAGESRAHDHGLEVLTIIAKQFHVTAGQALISPLGAKSASLSVTKPCL